MNILLTAYLHLLRGTQQRTLLKLREWIARYRPDALVVAGDLSSAPQAAETLKNLRHCFLQGPIAVCLGNHDFWMLEDSSAEPGSLSGIVERCWLPAAASLDIVLLDAENLRLPEITIVGGYGHYDLGFAVPDLAYDGILVTDEDYARGAPPSGGTLRWRDFQFMPCDRPPKEIAREQVDGVRERMAAAADSRTLVVLHTPPFEELLGVPPVSPVTAESAPSVYAFFRAYLGNRSMGVLLRQAQDNLVGVVCGHTHRCAGPLNLGRTIGINIGSDYGVPKAALLSSGSNRFERLPE
jgi:Icc-related predicted phosphoesterase